MLFGIGSDVIGSCLEGCVIRGKDVLCACELTLMLSSCASLNVGMLIFIVALV